MSQDSRVQDKNIYKFAKKYSELFKKPEINSSDLDDKFLKECSSLGFSLEEGEEFEKDFPEALEDMQELGEVIENIYSVNVLGSIIYYKWYTDSRRNSEEEEPLDMETIVWFNTAFRRLFDLASLTYQPPFLGQLERFELNSVRSYEEELPHMGDESSQAIIIYRDGRVEFVRSLYDDRLRSVPIHRQEVSMEAHEAAELLDQIAKFFSDEFVELNASNMGVWKANLTHANGEEYNYSGPLYYINELGTHELSDTIRETFNKPNLLAFDGGMNRDHIKRLALRYHQHPLNEKESENESDIWESITLDRSTGSVHHERRGGGERAIDKTYSLESEVGDFLDNLKYYGSYLSEKDLEDRSELKKEKPLIKDYVLVITSKNSPTVMRKGSYETQNPLALEDLIDEFHRLIKS